MKSEKNFKIVLLTGLNNSFIGELIERLTKVPGATIENVVFWSPSINFSKKLRNNIRRHGLIYVLYRLFREINQLSIVKLKAWFEKLLLIPKVNNDLFSACAEKNIGILRIKDIHSPEGVDLIRSLDCDLLVVCGTGILKKKVFDLPRIGTINLHQGQIQKYRGAPPGFWELWNNEKEAGVTIHFIDEGIDTGDIIIQKRIPIFEYDDLRSVEGKLEELSLFLYPEAIRLIIEGKHQRIPQRENKGKLYSFPTLFQSFRHYVKLKKRKFHRLRPLKNIVNKAGAMISLIAIYSRDTALRKLAKKNVLSVLYYHRVSDFCQDGMTVSLKEFEWQIRLLKKKYHVLSASELDNWLDEDSKIKGKKAVLISFDDGYEDNYLNALPILRKYACPAIFFVSTGLINNERQFEHDQILQPQLIFRKMTWSQLKEAMSTNVEIGIHSDSHANLGRISIEESIMEIENSIQKYIEAFKKKPTLMSYPFGNKEDITPEVIRYIRDSQIIRCLFSAYGNKNISPINRWNIKRTNIGSYDKGLIYWFKVEGGLRTLLIPNEM